MSVHRPTKGDFFKREEAVELAMQIQAHTYLECAAEDNRGVELIFQTLAWYGVRYAASKEATREKDRNGGGGKSGSRSRSRNRRESENCIIA